ncbi:unnamed protein product [Meganyctiphanes norvegica]|uniref:Chitin-binding type-2 domain-containing protein n=1 Tax=Meganyctiphanes norvegica TaxID=48144 RepID=A0AAV2Q0L7_MEGNR
MDKSILITLLCYSCLLDLSTSEISLCPDPEPDCSHQDYASDPKDCHYYYKCVHGNPANRTSCPPDTFFNSLLVDSGLIPCMASSDCAVTCKCTQTCVELGQIYADVTDCKKFKVCLQDPNGEFFSATGYCDKPEYPYFNGKMCVESDEYCCKQ